jgi:hypothetical protein
MISVAEKSSLNKLQISLLSFLESRLKMRIWIKV